MAHFRNFFILNVFLFLLFPSLISAGTVQGEVTAVNPNAQAFTIKRGDSPVRSEINFRVTEDTELEGIDSVLDLATGDEVIVDTVDEKNQVGQFEARAVRISKIKIHEPIAQV